MARKHVPITTDFPYHITARTVNREPFKINLAEAWEIYTELLNFCRSAFSIDFFAFLLMPNHFHMLCKCHDPNLDKFMHHFMRESCRHINGECGRINQLYGGSYHKSLVETQRYFQLAHKYVYRNPVAANIVTKAEDYPFTTLRSVIGLDSIKVPIHDEMALSAHSLDSMLDWINTPFSSLHSKNIKNGLQHSKFTLVKSQVAKAHPLELSSVNFNQNTLLNEQTAFTRDQESPWLS